MMKLLLLVAGFLLVYWVLKAYGRGLRKPDPSQSAQQVSGEDMVRCSHCGVHLPRSESISAQGQSFCSEEHRRLH